MLRAGTFYVAAVWALAQGIAQLGPSLGLADTATRWFLVAAAIGFPFWLLFAWFYEFTPQGFRRETEVAPEDSIAHATGRKLDFWIIGVLAMAVVLLLTDRFVVRQDATAAIPEQSIAVLPLANEGGNPGDQYFSDGLSEDMITALSQLDGLKVISRNSSFQFRDSREPSASIGHKLGVAHLLEGSVRRAGDTVRISASLVKAADGTTVWSQRFDRPYRELFALQDEITRAVSGALEVRLLPQAAGAAQSDRPPSGDLAAYDAVLQGNFHYAQGNEAHIREAIAAYQRALALDPDYAHAYARLAYAQLRMANFGLAPDQLPLILEQARQSAATARRLGPNLADAYAAEGWVLDRVDSNFEGALAALGKAGALAPRNSSVVLRTGVIQAGLGQWFAAVATLQRAVALDPLSGDAYFDLSLPLTQLGRYAEAEAALRRSLALQPDGTQGHAFLAIVQVLEGEAAMAVASARQEPDPFWRQWALAIALHANGEQAAADVALQELIAAHADDAGSQIAQVYAVRGQPDEMFHWLEHARQSDPGVREVLSLALLGRYYADPRFAVFCKSVGLPPPPVRTVAGAADG